MLARRTLQARQLRAEAIALAGGRCALCSGGMDLQFHLHQSDGGAHHSLGSVERARFYLLAVKQGRATLLCRPCHARAHRLAGLAVASTFRVGIAQVPRPPAVKASDNGQR
jgi:hypothetical protein